MRHSLVLAGLTLAFAAQAAALAPAYGLEENKGQFSKEILYRSRLGVSVTADSVIFDIGATLQLNGANPAAILRPGDTLPGPIDIIGPGERRTLGIRQYSSLVRTDVYPGIDAAVFANGGVLPYTKSVEYVFTVHAGADPGAIRIGVMWQKTDITLANDFLLPPVASQGRARYVRLDAQTVSFVVDSYDPTRDFTITVRVNPDAATAGILPGPFRLTPSGDTYTAVTICDEFCSLDVAARTHDVLDLIHWSSTGQVLHIAYFIDTGAHDVRAIAVHRPWYVEVQDIAAFVGITTARDLPLTPNAARKDYAPLYAIAMDGATGAVLYSTYVAGASSADRKWNVQLDNGSGLTIIGPLDSRTVYARKIHVAGFMEFDVRLPETVSAADVDAGGNIYFTGYAYPTNPVKQASDFGGSFAGRLSGGVLNYGIWLGPGGPPLALVADIRGRAWLIYSDHLSRLDYTGSTSSLLPGPVPPALSLSSALLATDRNGNLVIADPYGPVSKYDATGALRLHRMQEPSVSLALDANGNLLELGYFGVSVVSLAVDAPGIGVLYHGASWIPSTTVAPGEIITLTGSGLGPSHGVSYQPNADGRVPILTGGTRILVNGVPAPVLYAQNSQVNAIIPFSVQPGAKTAVQPEVNGNRLAPFTVEVAAAYPGIFTLNGKEPVIFNEDGTVNSDANPARSGSIVTFFATGLGVTTPPSVEGAIAESTDAKPRRENYYVTFDIGPADVVYAGPSLGSLTSITQFNVRVSLRPVYGDLADLPLTLWNSRGTVAVRK